MDNKIHFTIFLSALGHIFILIGCYLFPVTSEIATQTSNLTTKGTQHITLIATTAVIPDDSNININNLANTTTAPHTKQIETTPIETTAIETKAISGVIKVEKATVNSQPAHQTSHTKSLKAMAEAIRQSPNENIPTPTSITSHQSTASIGTLNESGKADSVFDEYLAMIIATIEEYKFFPAAARRRGIEGDIQVTFRLSSNGEVRNLALTGGHRLLTNAVKNALKQASPFSPPPKTIPNPINLSYTISFNLK